MIVGGRRRAVDHGRRARRATGRRRSACRPRCRRRRRTSTRSPPPSAPVRRVWRRVMPTARISPISRVRSNTPSASVIEMPSTAMTMANAEQHRDDDQQLVDLGLLLARGTRRWTAPRPAGTAPARPRRPRRPAAGVDAVGQLGGTKKSRAWPPADLVERVERDQPVAGQRGVVVDAGDGQVGVSPFWNVTGTVSPTARSRSSAGSLWTSTPPSARPS